ncbi:hypothetical protein GE09DRAFT_1210101 [Coniochaeta sp. 2T2.1]|nr:hypothetical protein GE09DRAFT_1210101 [Coniochaeta sp. 2T2.1]
MSADEKELAAFLSALNEGSLPPVRPVAASHLPPTHPSYAPDRPSSHSAALNEATLPTNMSCRDAFDYAWHCHTPAAQFQSVYRYGGVRTCSDLWDDFWFCMRTKQYSPEMRAEAVREHFRRRLNERYYAPGRKSSEDVWESREGIVSEGSAFRHGFDEPKEDDKEWNLREIERRRRIREEHFGQKEGGN